MNNNGNKEGPVNLGPAEVAVQIVINLRKDNTVDGSTPTDMKVTFYMIGEFLKRLGANLELKKVSPIIQPPPGLNLGGPK